MRRDDRWEHALAGLFDDLEQQAEGLALAARDAEVAEQVRAEYAQVDLLGRLHGSLGALLRLQVAGAGILEGRLLRVGSGWCLLEQGRQDWVVPVAAIESLRGLAARALAGPARPLGARLGLSSALRGVAEARGDVVLHRRDGSTTRGVLGRVGADFVEVLVGEPPASQLETLPIAGLTAVRTG